MSDQEIMSALSRLLLENKEREELKEEKGTETNKSREGRQFDGFASAAGDCETTGFETKVSEECEEGSNIECKKVNVTQFRTEIKPRCKTLFDQIIDNCPPTCVRCETEYNHHKFNLIIMPMTQLQGPSFSYLQLQKCIIIESTRQPLYRSKDWVEEKEILS